MFFIHPGFLLCSCLLSMGYYVSIKGAAAFKTIAAMIPIFALVSVINPIFSKYGATVLFTYFGGRPYTLESLYYGMAIGAMFVTVIMWFASYNLVMTSDKFMYLFGKTAPSITLVLTMVLRLVPNFTNKMKQIIAARRSVGKAGGEGKKELMRDGVDVLSAITNWAFEGGITTADSMRSRGYGTGKRGRFSIYRFDGRDVMLGVFMIALAVIIVICAVNGGMDTRYVPMAIITGPDNPYCVTGLAAYVIFLGIPTVLNVAEDIKWHILRSRI